MQLCPEKRRALRRLSRRRCRFPLPRKQKLDALSGAIQGRPDHAGGISQAARRHPGRAVRNCFPRARREIFRRVFYFPNLELCRLTTKLRLYARFSLRWKQAVLRRRRRRGAGQKIRHAALRLFAADAGGSFSKARRRARAARPPGLFRDEGELQPLRAADAGQSRRRLRHRERGRIAARHRGGRRPGKCVFAGVGKSEAEIEFALRQGIYSFNCRERAGNCCASTRWRRG